MNARSFSLAEFAAELGLPTGPSGRAGKQRVYRMVVNEELRAVRVGKELRVPASELDRLLATDEQRSA